MFDPFSRRVTTAISCRLHVSDSCLPAFAGHADAIYASPLADPVPNALALARLLIGSDGARPWDRAIPGGRRTVWLAPVSESW
jgi:hypothetical protein